MRRIGERLEFGRRQGTILGHTTVERDEEPQTFYVVELDGQSMAYLEPRGYDGVNHVEGHDCFISMILVNVDSFDAGTADEIGVEEVSDWFYGPDE